MIIIIINASPWYTFAFQYSIPSISLKFKNTPTTINHLYEGKRKWLGGAITSDQSIIYGIPAHAHSIIRIKVQKENYQIDSIALPIQYQKRRFKWLRGLITDNDLFGIPSWSSAGVLHMNIHNYDINVLPLPNLLKYNRWLWHGASMIATETNIRIYCIPANANYVLKISNSNQRMETSYIGPDLSHQNNKWYGGILGYDQAVYGIPYAANSILRIDTNNDTVSLLGDFGHGQYNWHGGILSPINGAIYAFPSHAETILKINTQNQTFTQLPIDAPTQILKQKYKWLGGTIGMDNCIYGMPSDCTSILRIDPNTDICTIFGSTALSKMKGKNKWQGGVLANDGCIYAIPSDANCVLQIDTHSNIDDGERIAFIDTSIDSVSDKWQGGFLASDGNIYAIPENADRILRVVIGDKKQNSYLELL